MLMSSLYEVDFQCRKEQITSNDVEMKVDYK